MFSCISSFINSIFEFFTFRTGPTIDTDDNIELLNYGSINSLYEII